MYFSIFTIIIILSYQCLITGSKRIRSYDNSRFKLRNTGNRDCSILIDPRDMYLPVPYEKGPNASIIHPDVNGILRFKINSTIQLVCPSSQFKLPTINDQREIAVVCLRNSLFKYKDNTYQYLSFRCEGIPTSKLKMTSHKCQKDNSVAAVGFQTKNKFLILYNICFDMVNKIPLYSWYFANPHHYSNHQSSHDRPIFIKSKQYYDKIDIHTMYKKQAAMVRKTLRSEDLMRKYINTSIENEQENFLARGHLVARTEFGYGFEQEATFYYENSAPMWQVFNKNIWIHVEQFISQNLAESNSNHVVITGTFGLCTLPDIDHIQRPLYLSYPIKQVPVPLFIWKMVIDRIKKKSIVYIGLNDPYREINETSFMCKPLLCPKEIFRILRDSETDGLVYCCSRRSFEYGYGERVHPIIFHRNLV